MNPFSKALKEKARLSKFGRKLFRSRNFKESASPQEWIDSIQIIKTYRKHRDLSAKLITVILILCIVIILFTLYIGEPLYSLLALIGIIICINFLCYLRKGKFAIACADLLCPVIATLREDMKPGAPLEISLDISGSTTSQKKKESRKIPRNQLMPSVKSRTDHYFEDPWLIVRGKLIDQTAFQIHLQNDTRQAKSVKRSASGKTKHKSKFKHKVKQLVTLKPPVEAEPVNPSPVNAAYPTMIKEREEGFAITATRQSEGAGKALPFNINADQILEMFACACARYTNQ